MSGVWEWGDWLGSICAAWAWDVCVGVGCVLTCLGLMIKLASLFLTDVYASLCATAVR